MTNSSKRGEGKSNPKTTKPKGGEKEINDEKLERKLEEIYEKEYAEAMRLLRISLVQMWGERCEEKCTRCTLCIVWSMYDFLSQDFAETPKLKKILRKYKVEKK